MNPQRDRGTDRRQAWQGGLVGFACAVGVAVLQSAGLFEPLEFRAYDAAWRASPVFHADAPPGGIMIVAIDQGSLEHVYRHQGMRWPWPRLYHGLMIEFLDAAGARAIVFDIFFTEPDIERLDITAAESDAALRTATDAAGNVIHAAVLLREGLPPDPDKLAALQRSLARRPVMHAGPPPSPHTAALLPAPGLIDGALAIGSVTVETDRDNILRRLRPIQSLDGLPVPALAVSTAAAVADSGDIALHPGELVVGKKSFPLADDGTLYPRWYRAPAGHLSTFPLVSAADVITSRIRQLHGESPLIDPALIRDRIVLIGSTAPGLTDIKASPLSHAEPGVVLQATLLANLLRGEAVRRLPSRIVLLLLLAGCLLTGCAARGWRRHVGGPLVWAAFVVALPVTGFLLLTRRLEFLPIMSSLAGVTGTYFAVTVLNHVSAQRQTRLVRGLFEHYLDRAVVQDLIRHPDRLRLGGELRDCTVLFADVANFTALSERMTPETLVLLMNLYFESVTDVIVAAGGFVDKFVGDEIVAVFGAPAPLPDHAVRACQAALTMQARLAAMQPAFREVGCTGELFARTGISTGSVVIGNMGSRQRMNYTAMGDTMNLGARIEGANKLYGTRILIAEATAAASGDAFRLREVDAVRVVGRQAGLRLFELLDSAAGKADDTQPRYAAALADYRAGRWRQAGAAFTALATEGDAPAAAMAARCHALAAAPPDTWDGITDLLSK